MTNAVSSGKFRGKSSKYAYVAIAIWLKCFRGRTGKRVRAVKRREGVARSPSLYRVWVIVPSCVLAAKASGRAFVADSSKEVSHRAILRHAVLVHDDRCLRRACVVVLFASELVR